MEAGVLPTRNEGQKGFHAQETHRALLGFTLYLENSLSYMAQLKDHLSRELFLN